MKHNRYLIFLLILVCFCCNPYLLADTPSLQRFRGAWVASVANIDWPSQEAVGNESKQRQEMVWLLDSLQQLGINAIVFQVRPTADALYASKLEPWSHWLTGQQGKASSFDPLEFTIQEAKKRGIEVHAWLNPFRVNIPSMKTSRLTPDHIFYRHPQWFWYYGEQWYFNPALPETRDWICAVVEDIVCRYDIAAIHMDDYFYPYPISGKELPDRADFQRNPRGFTQIADWRRDNVNQAIEAISKTIRRTKPNVQFGISPFGVYKDGTGLTNYHGLYADIIYWIEQGWIDYVTPQLYWYIGFSKADYAPLAYWWADAVQRANEQYTILHAMDPTATETGSIHRPCQLYIGMSPYKLGTGKEDSPWQQGNEIARQMRLNQSISGIQGECFYSTRPLLKNPLHVCDSIRSIYQVELAK